MVLVCQLAVDNEGHDLLSDRPGRWEAGLVALSLSKRFDQPVLGLIWCNGITNCFLKV